MDNFVELNEAIGISMIIMITLGTITNLATFLVCIRKGLRNIPTFVFIAFKAIIDIIPFFGVNLDWMISSNLFNKTHIAYKVPSYCIIQHFLHFFPLKSSAWILVGTCILIETAVMYMYVYLKYYQVAMGVERFLSVQIKTWRMKLFNAKKAALVSSFIIGFFFITDFYLNFGNMFIESSNKVANETFYTSKCVKIGTIVSIYFKMNTFAYSIIPFLVLVVFNVLSINKTYRSKKSSGAKNSIVKKLTILVIIKTSLFFVFTAPIAIGIANGLSDEKQSEDLSTILKCLNLWRFIQHSLHFYILYSVNMKFRKECIRAITCARDNIVVPTVSIASIAQSIKSMKVMKKNLLEA